MEKELDSDHASHQSTDKSQSVHTQISQLYSDVKKVEKGVQEIEAIGSELDTDLHEAVAKLPVEDDKKGKIIDVVQKGYKLKDKVVRYAKVVVGE